MPAAKPRYTLTETEDLAAALDSAARRWPEDAGSRTRLLLRLVEAGERAINREHEFDVARRRVAVERTAGALTGVYVRGSIEELSDEWPA